MGYNITIRKKDNTKISVSEWKAYISSDSEFQPIEIFTMKTSSGTEFGISTPNAGLWTYNDLKVPFTFSERYGTIAVKNPDKPVLKKMLEIAHFFQAILVGEEGELYDQNSLKNF